MKTSRLIQGLLGVVCFGTMALVRAGALEGGDAAANLDFIGGRDAMISLTNWSAPRHLMVKATQGSERHLKAATDYATVYRPVTPCRLVDTRGNGAPVTLGTTPFTGGAAPNGHVQTVSPGSACGIPGSAVRALSLSFHAYNYTTSNGGYISFSSVGAAAGAANAVFNVGALWTAATANVPAGSSGNFDVHVIQSNIELIVDVNGYYQDLDSLDVGTQQFDIYGSGTGDVLEVWNSGTGSALGLDAPSGGIAMNVYSGRVTASGAGVNTSTFAFIHQVDTTPFASGGTGCPLWPDFSVIDHPMLNGKPNAIILVTPRNGTGMVYTSNVIAPYYMSLANCGTGSQNHWLINDTSATSLINHTQFNVIVISAD